MDPERPIEKLLRQAAQARRAQAGAPQELHPANRRMLQSEIAHKFGSGTVKKHSFFELLMPRLGWAAAMLVGLGLAAALMFPRQNGQPKEMFFAKNERVSAPQSMDESRAAAAAPTVTTAPQAPALARADQYDYAGAARSEVALERDKDSLNAESRRAEGQRKQLAVNEPTTAREAGTAVGGAGGGEKQKEELANRSVRASVPIQSPQTAAPPDDMRQRRYGLATSAQAIPSAPAGAAGFAPAEAKPTDEMAKAKLADSGAASRLAPPPSSLALQLNGTTSAEMAKRSPAPIARASQQFVQNGSVAKKVAVADQSAVAKPVLVSFELQQLGREVRIVDSDGSVYLGNFQTPQTFHYLDSETGQKSEVTSSLRAAAPSNNNLAVQSESTVERKGALNDTKLQADLSYAFEVRGTNKTLKQFITFSGEVLTPTNVLSVVGPAGTLNGNRAAPPELNPLPLGNSRISGKVLIGNNQEVEVNAIPAH